MMVAMSHPRIGVGYDIHRLELGRPLILGGIHIPHRLGLLGHSDADVVCHALTDAILGALALGKATPQEFVEMLQAKNK